MEDIKVGEWVRTKTGYIAKVRNIICKCYPIKLLEGYIICDDEDGTILNPEEVKHSFNLTDLIEVGDYVNGHKVVNEIYGEDDNNLYFEIEGGFNKAKYIAEKDIKTILTREQFEANAYKVKGE